MNKPVATIRKVSVSLALILAIPSISAQQNSDHAIAAADTPSSLSIEAQSGISAAIGRDLPSYRVRTRASALEVENAKQKLTVGFSAAGIQVQAQNATWNMALRAEGRGSRLQPVDGVNVTPTASQNRVEYRRGSLTEWYENGPLGLEQGFTLQEPPPAGATNNSGTTTEPMVLALSLSGNLTASADRGGMSLTLADAAGHPQLRYASLSARDASDRQLHSWMEVQGQQLLLKVDDAHARYPIVVDPIVQLAKLTPSDGVHLGFFGASVAIAGNTVAVGTADTSLPGAVYIFTKPAHGWANMTQTAKLTASDGAENDYLGYSVALSGNTLVAGAPNANNYVGATYIFIEPASGWVNMTETTKLKVSGTTSTVGASVGIGGNTIVVGAPDESNNGIGAAFVYVKPKTGWTSITQTATLTPSNGEDYDAFGTSVAISGNTVAAVGPGQSNAYVFVKPTRGWANMTQTALLSGSGGTTNAPLAISGNTIVCGSPYATIGSNYAQGEANIYVEPVGGWTNMAPTATLTASDGAANNWFGYGVAISGNRIVAGAPFASVGGAAYSYLEPANGWKTTSHFSGKATAADAGTNDQLGWSVSLSGGIFIAGAPGDNLQNGAAYIF